MKRFFVVVVVISISFGLKAQTRVLSEESVNERARRSELNSKSIEKLEAEEFARRNDLPVRLVSSDGAIREIKRITASGMPVYLKTSNLNAAKTVSTDKVWEGGGLDLSLTGSGIVVGVWDGGIVRKSHVEFGGRIRVINSDSDESSHATHVAGTIGAQGIRSGARGMAGSCAIDSYYWGNDNDEMNYAANLGMLLSNHSYGFIQGWDYDADANKWKWYGDVNVSGSEDYNFGFYGVDAKVWDDISYDNPYYLIVKSAGNDRGEGPSPGTEHLAWENGGWLSSTDSRDKDGSGGFDCIGSQGTSKNILTVGAIDDMPDGYNGLSSVNIASFSCFGPTDDGRIKPDIVGNGTSLLSSTTGSDDAYGTSSGTSMSSPNVTGSLVLLQEHYRNLFGKYMYSSMLKSLVLHTADDAGTPGPDYKYGWGVMNTASAAKLISGENDGAIFHDTLFSKIEKVYNFYSTGKDSIKITIAWTDPAGEVPAIQLDPKDKILVNDLDIRLIRKIDGKVFMPYVLFPSSPGRTAETGDNTIDNVEQILNGEKMQGYYQLIVSNKYTLKEAQAFALVTSGLTKEYVASGFNELVEPNGELILTSAQEYQNNMDVQWLIKPSNEEKVSLYFDHFETELNDDTLTIYDGADVLSPVLAKFSGELSNIDTIVEATGSEMLLYFGSDSEETYSGFKARYCTVAPEGDFLIAGEEYPCANSTNSYFALGQAGAEYRWSSISDWGMQNQSENGIDLLIEDGNDEIQVVPYNRCGEGVKSEFAIQALPGNPVLEFLSGDNEPCVEVPSLYTTSEEVGAEYVWEFPETWLGSSKDAQISLEPSDESGPVKVSAINSCGTSNKVELDIQVLKRPDSEFIYTDQIPACKGNIQEFYILSKPDHTYQWTANGDWTIDGDSDKDTVLIEVGQSSNFVEVTSINKCGERNSGRLFLTQDLPEKPVLQSDLTKTGYTLLQVVNDANFERIQWYHNGLPIEGPLGLDNPLIASRNGLYTVASVSNTGCFNLLSDNEGEFIDAELLDFVVYRNSESTISIENTLSVNAEYNILSLQGVLRDAGVLSPGNNEIQFEENGLYIIYIFGYGETVHVSKRYL